MSRSQVTDHSAAPAPNVPTLHPQYEELILSHRTMFNHFWDVSTLAFAPQDVCTNVQEDWGCTLLDYLGFRVSSGIWIWLDMWIIKEVKCMSSFPNQRVDQSWGGGEPQDPTRARPTQPELINPRSGFYKIKPQSEFLQSLFWSCYAEYFNQKKLGLIRKHCQRHNRLGILNL